MLDTLLQNREDALAGKPVTFRGKVVKTNPDIMGKNWLHVRDGSGEEGTNDLTITTADTVAVGDVVTAKGKVYVDKDFGAGYAYPVIVEVANPELKLRPQMTADISIVVAVVRDVLRLPNAALRFRPEEGSEAGSGGGPGNGRGEARAQAGGRPAGRSRAGAASCSIPRTTNPKAGR